MKLADAYARALLASLAMVTGCAPRNGPPGTGVEECVPGETVIVACAPECGVGGPCAGTGTRLRVCDGELGAEGCVRATDDSSFVEFGSSALPTGECGRTCPRGRVVCPLSGSIAIARRFIVDGARCDWAVEHRGLLPGGGRPGETVACEPGSTREVGCALACGIGESAGSPELHVCDGAASIADCAAGTAEPLPRGTFWDPDTCGGPHSVVVCPASGQMTIAPVTAGEEICEWAVRDAPNRAGGTEVCSPGQRLTVACAAGCGLGSCVAQPAIRVCDGNFTPEQCDAFTDSSQWLADGVRSRDGCDERCPSAMLTCPGSGAITVVPRPGFFDAPFACDWQVGPTGLAD